MYTKFLQMVEAAPGPPHGEDLRSCLQFMMVIWDSTSAVALGNASRPPR
jgi:hypothetical protein